MTAPPFDGPAYRRNVLTTLRERNPAEVEDLFWLVDVPREVDDEAAIAERLKAARGFLFKERTRARQAAVAQAVLNEWPRIEATLLDPASRAALRRRLEQAGPSAPAAAERPKPAPAGGDRRRRQVNTSLAELARLRDDPDLGSDLFSFLGLPTSATREMLAARIEKIGEVNRRRRPDRERSLTDDLLAHARKLLLEGDPAEYLAGFDDEFRDRVVDALLAGDVEAARAALGAARARGVSDAAILARLESARAARAAALGRAATRLAAASRVAARRAAAQRAAARPRRRRADPPLRARPRHVCAVCDTVASPGRDHVPVLPVRSARALRLLHATRRRRPPALLELRRAARRPARAAAGPPRHAARRNRRARRGRPAAGRRARGAAAPAGRAPIPSGRRCSAGWPRSRRRRRATSGSRSSTTRRS